MHTKNHHPKPAVQKRPSYATAHTKQGLPSGKRERTQYPEAQASQSPNPPNFRTREVYKMDKKYGISILKNGLTSETFNNNNCSAILRCKVKFDTKQEGLRTLFKPYQVLLLEHLWDLNGQSRVGLTSGQAHKYLMDKPESKSRASVIFFMNDMVDDGILDYEEKTGKGGYHRVYYPKMDRVEFAEHASNLINEKLKTIFKI
jgi:hypothetical protein